MKAIATKQPTNESVKQNKSGEKGRSRSMSPLSTGMPLLQRKCACGGGCPRCQDELGIQTKLKIGEPGDKYEQEADRIADEVMRMPEPSVQRKTIANPTPLNSEQSPSEVPPIVHEVLNSPSQPLHPETRTFMESRFKHDFSQVRVHTDARAAESAQAVQAIAYTFGRSVVFGIGQYTPRTIAGRKLIAHELTHVLQQSSDVHHPGKAIRPIGSQIFPRKAIASQTIPLIQRVVEPVDPQTADPIDPLLVYRDAPNDGAPNAKTWNDAPPKCGNFCRPLPSVELARASRRELWPTLQVGIALRVSPRVIPLWDIWAFGGSPVMDLTKDFGPDFAASPTTMETTRFLMGKIKAKLTASPPVIPPAGHLKLDIPKLIPADVKAIDDSNSPNQMNFGLVGDIPGNIAGGIGKSQATTPIGLSPSPQDDERIAKGDLTIWDTGTSLVVIPNLSYTVKDTIDFCPGDCGADLETMATIPMSQWEATGISGDVPFTVDFPASWQLPFVIPKSGSSVAPSPVPAPAPKTP